MIVAVGGIFVVTQVPAARELITQLQGADQLTPEEELAQDKQSLSEQQAYLDWKKYCAAQGIDDGKCNSLWEEQKSLDEAKRELTAQQAIIDQQKQEQANAEAAAKAAAEAEESARAQAEADALAAEKARQEAEAQAAAEAAEREAAAQQAAKLKELATPKSGYISITGATLVAGSGSSVTIHNLLPNNCSGANWCNNVTIEKVFVDGVEMRWHGVASSWNLMAEGTYTKIFYGATENTGTITVTGHYGSQAIFAEYSVS